MKKHALTLWVLIFFCLPAMAADDFDIYSVNPADYQPMPAQSPDLLPRIKPRGASSGSAVIYDRSRKESTELPADSAPVRTDKSSAPQPGPRSSKGSPQTGLTPQKRSFSNLTLAGQLTTYPRSAMVKILFTGRGGNYSCSGTIIDRNLVITAGHCVYDYDNQEPFTDFIIIPAYDYYAYNSEPFGRASVTRILYWENYSKYDDVSYDIGLLKLRMPIGDYTGWLGYGHNPNCNFLINNTFHNFSYPGDEYQGRQMYYRFGTFDECVNFLGTSNPYKMARIWNRGIHGQSGSSAYLLDVDDARYVYAITSTASVSQTNFARINSSQFDQIKSFKNSDSPTEKAELLLLCATRVHDYWFYGQSRDEDANYFYAFFSSGWTLAIGKDGQTFMYRMTPNGQWNVANMDAINQTYCVPHGEGY